MDQTTTADLEGLAGDRVTQINDPLWVVKDGVRCRGHGTSPWNSKTFGMNSHASYVLSHFWLLKRRTRWLVSKCFLGHVVIVGFATIYVQNLLARTSLGLSHDQRQHFSVAPVALPTAVEHQRA